MTIPVQNKQNPVNPVSQAPHVTATQPEAADTHRHVAENATAPTHDLPAKRQREFGGQPGPEPTRYGDWEKNGRCTDF